MRLPKQATRLAPNGVAIAMTAMKTMIGRPITTSGESRTARPIDEQGAQPTQLVDRPEDALRIERQEGT